MIKYKREENKRTAKNILNWYHELLFDVSEYITYLQKANIIPTLHKLVGKRKQEVFIEVGFCCLTFFSCDTDNYEEDIIIYIEVDNLPDGSEIILLDELYKHFNIAFKFHE